MPAAVFARSMLTFFRFQETSHFGLLIWHFFVKKKMAHSQSGKTVGQVISQKCAA
jgi:hypothetical protein